MKFTLDFKSDNYGKKIIDEPFGTSAISFMLKQKADNMARDISVTGAETDFEFTNMRNHELKQLLYYRRKFGYEAIVTLTIEIESGYKIVYDLDFAKAETDDLEYFKCKGIQEGKFQIMKRRRTTKVDVLSDTDIDGNYIGGLIPENMLLLAKTLIQNSRWEGVGFDERLYAQGTGADSRVFYAINPSLNLQKSDIEDSFTFFYSFARYKIPSEPPFSDYLVVKAKTNLKNIQVSIKDLKIQFTTDVDNGGDGYVDVQLQLRHGLDYETATKVILLSVTKNEHESYDFYGNLFHTISSLQRDESIWINFIVQVRQSKNIVIGGTPRFECFLKIPTMNTDIVAESVAYNSISKSLRLVDVLRQVVKSISGLQINAPRFEAMGQFFDNRLMDGNFLRGVNNKPFSISLEDIEKSFTEMKGDWEIGSDGKIFFGIEQDFYKPIEIGFFDNTQFSEMNKTFNPKFMINEFKYLYKNYQSLKENEEPNSADTIHGESRFAFFNKSVENSKSVEIEWTRDAFLIEATRKKALEITETTSSQDDNTLFCIDSRNTLFDNSFVETSFLKHSFAGNLKLTSDGTINFLSLGIQVGSAFSIFTPDINAGDYTVVSVLNNVLELTGAGSGAGNGIRSTKYSYFLEANFVPFTNYTYQGFSETENLNAAESYSNRRYSIARNIYNYWQSYLAACNLYWREKVIKNTWYKNNGDYTAKYDGIKLTEKADFVPKNPILSPNLYNDIIFSNVEFEDFITIQEKARSDRGYIRTLDNNNEVVKLFPVDMEYKLLEKELIIKGEEKYDPVSMTISTEFDYVLINNETRTQSLLWEIIGQKLYIYDENRFRLYNGVYWMEVAVNGAIPNSIEQLENWLSLVN